jgi:hypothetical protein
MSNYPAGAEFDPNAPYNQEDAKPSPYWVTVHIRVIAIDGEHAVDKVEEKLNKTLLSSNYEIQNVVREE